MLSPSQCTTSSRSDVDRKQQTRVISAAFNVNLRGYSVSALLARLSSCHIGPIKRKESCIIPFIATHEKRCPDTQTESMVSICNAGGSIMHLGSITSQWWDQLCCSDISASKYLTPRCHTWDTLKGCGVIRGLKLTCCHVEAVSVLLSGWHWEADRSVMSCCRAPLHIDLM